MFPLRLILAGIPAAPFSLSSRRSDDTTMFAARVRASLKPLFHGRHSSSLGRNCCEIAATSRRVLLDRFNDEERTPTSFHSSTQCYSSGTDVGVKTRTPAVLFTSLEDDLFSELGSVEKDRNGNMVVQLLTKMPEPFQDEKPKLSQNTKGRKKKKKKKHEQASDSISKPKLLTEKPEVSRKTNGERKTEAHAFSPARNVTDSYVSFSKPSKSSSPIPDHKSKAQNITSPSSEANYKTSSKGSSPSNSHANHPSLTVVLRIGNLNSKTTDSMIHSRCLSIGSLEGLARVDEDNVEVLFRARNMNEANSILEKLNGSTVDHSQWMAEIVPEAEEVSRDQMGMRMSSCFEDLEKQLMMRRLLLKDLDVLVHSVIHLENHPMAREGTKASGCSQEA